MKLSIEIADNKKTELLNYCMKRGVTVSWGVRNLIDRLLSGEITLEVKE